jgi:hypothetical protein
MFGCKTHTVKSISQFLRKKDVGQFTSAISMLKRIVIVSIDCYIFLKWLRASGIVIFLHHDVVEVNLSSLKNISNYDSLSVCNCYRIATKHHSCLLVWATEETFMIRDGAACFTLSYISKITFVERYFSINHFS